MYPVDIPIFSEPSPQIHSLIETLHNKLPRFKDNPIKIYNKLNVTIKNKSNRAYTVI